MTKKRFYLILGIWAISQMIVSAKHIIGGVITYEHKGNGKYLFTMRIYRDCNGGGAPFDGDNGDNGAIINIFSENNGNYKRVFDTRVKLDDKDKIQPPNYPCISLPPNVCAEEGVYQFEYTIPNFPSDLSYHVVYQRCCRNNTITNIVKPGDAGATYEIVITPEAQKVGSSSPVFKNFPPTIICGNIPFSFDHSATDVDGDSLYYRFCSPLYGGGPDTNNNFSDCRLGARPDPLCPPPYDTVIYKLPFSSTKPLGANAARIDPKTGFLDGQVNQLGQYVVGICVEEYRNGVLLSKVFRDFQFNIAVCNILVKAAVQNDTIVAKRIIVNSCGTANVKFTNESTDKSKISAYQWDFTILGQVKSFKEENPTVSFPGLGKYNGRLIANPGLKPCTDTAYLEVNVYPDIEAKFRYTYDTCVAGPVKFTDLSTTGSGQLTSWKWEFRDGRTSSLQNPQNIYNAPGNYDVRLTVKDINGCKETATKVVRYFPVPATIIVKPDTAKGCQPLNIRLNNLSSPIDNTYKFDWDLGDGTKSTDLSPRHTYKDIGTYSVKLNLTSPIGCATSASFPSLIEVRGSPTAGFSFTPDKLSNFQNTATFVDESKNAINWTWQFDEVGGSSVLRNPVYTFRDTGFHIIRQIVTHLSGCRDTMTKTIDVEPLVTYFLPNAFTPNFDGRNDEFRGTGNLFGMTDFKMMIFNRWGERVFETTDPKEGWNGRIKNTGDVGIEGVYVYMVTFTGPRNKLFSYKGYATLLK